MTNETALAPRPGTLTIAQKQYDYICLDGSGSMMGTWWEMLDAIDSYVETLKSMGTRSHIHLSIFTSPHENIDLVARDVEIDQWVPLAKEPVGSLFNATPLYDAIEVMCFKLRNLNPERASLLIVTDGGETGSTVCDETRARSLLDWARAKGWSVTFIGCDFNNSSVAAKLGATESSAIGVQRRLLKNAVNELARKRHAYGLTGAPVHWSDAEKQQFGGYLAGPAR